MGGWAPPFWDLGEFLSESVGSPPLCQLGPRPPLQTWVGADGGVTRQPSPSPAPDRGGSRRWELVSSASAGHRALPCAGGHAASSGTEGTPECTGRAALPSPHRPGPLSALHSLLLRAWALPSHVTPSRLPPRSTPQASAPRSWCCHTPGTGVAALTSWGQQDALGASVQLPGRGPAAGLTWGVFRATFMSRWDSVEGVSGWHGKEGQDPLSHPTGTPHSWPLPARVTLARPSAPGPFLPAQSRDEP